jgi:hypothetical protein
MKRLSQEPRWSFLRRYVGLRINVFRAMHDAEFCVSGDRRLVALRDGDHALVARTEFDPTFNYFYIADCHWYRSDLERVADEEVPDSARHEMLRRFRSVLS